VIESRELQSIHARENFASDTIGIWIMKRVLHDAHKVAMVEVLQWSEYDVTAYIPATLHINRTVAQGLMDELWQCGLRPTEARGSAGAMAAVQEHLKDLRRLVFRDQS